MGKQVSDIGIIFTMLNDIQNQLDQIEEQLTKKVNEETESLLSKQNESLQNLVHAYDDLEEAGGQFDQAASLALFREPVKPLQREIVLCV